MLIIKLKKKGAGPAYRQAAEQIRDLIESGAIKEGEILPPTRRLAAQLNVSRYTACLAYQELWAQGYIASKPGSYSRVTGKRTAKSTGAPEPSLIDWAAATSPRAEDLYRRESELEKIQSPPRRDGLINLGAYDLDPGLFPMRELQKCLRRASDPVNAPLLHYGDAQGYLPLREYIAGKLASHSIRVTAEEILVTNGSLHGIDLVFKTLAGEGGRILVEVPTFHPVLSLCRVYGVRPVGIPLREDGMDTTVLKNTLREGRYRFLYTIPSFNNPTGITASRANRERALELCMERGLPIVEDAFEEEIKYVGELELPIKSMDHGHTVLSLGTFSKVLFPGMRIGWIAADARCIRRLLSVRRAGDESGGMLAQAAMAELCRAGHYERHLRKVNAVYAQRMKTALAALKAHVDPRKASWTEPRGGFLIWLTIKPTHCTESDLRGLMEAEGVWALPGSGFFTRKPPAIHLRLSISALDEERMVEGIKRLARALDRMPLAR